MFQDNPDNTYNLSDFFIILPIVPQLFKNNCYISFKVCNYFPHASTATW